MKIIKHLTLSAVAIGLISFGLRAEEAPARFDFVRPLGMGGAFTAVADDHNIFNFNPAGMVQRTGGQLTILEVAGGVSNDTLDAVDFINDNENDLTNWENLPPERQAELTNEIANDISKLDPRIYVAADVASYVSGPSFMGAPLHVGFGGFGTVNSTFRLDEGIVVPTVSYSINNDIILPVSLAKRWNAPWIIPGKIGIGATGKYIMRNQVLRERQSILELDDLEAPPVAKGTGLGLDLGLLYQTTDRLNIGLMVRDFGGTNLSFDKVDAEDGYQALPERDTTIRPRTNIGLSYVPKTLLFILPTSDRWIFAADVRDILVKDEHLVMENGIKKPFGEDLWTHVHLGAEFRYWFLRLRGGAYQGYPSLGLGVDIPVFKLDAAYYSREIGDQAGDRREENIIASIALRFGSGSVEGRERIKEVKDAKRERGMAAPEAEPAAAEPGEPAPEAGGEEIPE